MNDKIKDKNGFKLQSGTPVRLTQNISDYQNPQRVYHLEEINGKMYLTLPLDEFTLDGLNYQVESIR